MIRTDELIQEIRAGGHRITDTRRSLVELFYEHQKPHTPDEVRRFLSQRGINVNKTTIYRELDFLEQEGVISPVYFGDRSVRYELTHRRHHHHVVCISCGRVVDVALSHGLDKVQQQIERQTEFTITNHALEFFGLCNKCQ